MTELLIGCGYSRQKRLWLSGQSPEFSDLVTADHNIACDADIICDLNYTFWRGSSIKKPQYFMDNWEFKENSFTEVHAYEVLEHLGKQGDVDSFFSTFTNIWNVLCDGGHLFATVPSRYSCWLWGDPGHTRAILPETLIFLDQTNYKQCDGGRSMMSDYRSIYKSDFKIISSQDDKILHKFILQAVKPARITK